MKKLIIEILCIMTPWLSMAQVDSAFFWQSAKYDTILNFYDVVEIQDRYFKNHPDTLDEGGALREYYRWKYFWQNRVDNSGPTIGSINSALRRTHDVFNNIETWYPQVVASGSDWVFLGPKGLDEQHYGIVISIAVDKSANDFNTIYAGTGSSGLWKTTDGGKTWKNISDPAFSSGVGISSILIHSEDNNTIYIGTGTAGMDRKYGYGLGIYKSTDGGQSWSATSLAFQPEECTQIVKIICDPEYSERMIALSETAIFRTFDGWEHYQKVENYPQNWLDDCGLSWYYPYKALKDGLLFTENDTRKLYVTSSGFICCDVNNPTPCGAEIWELDDIFNHYCPTKI